MARDTGATSTWEERGSSAVQKTQAFLRGPDVDGFMHFSPDGPNDADMVEDTGDNFWHMTTSPGVEPVASYFEVGGFVHILG